jgi:SAM-dependent methyltransferase
MSSVRTDSSRYGSYPGNYSLRRGTLAQELRSVARPLKRRDLRGSLRATLPAAANVWNHYVRPHSQTRFVCSCCGQSTHAFVHLGDHRGPIWNSACQVCDSRSRHRGLALLIPQIMGQRTDFQRTLHFAPEGVLARVLLSFEQIDHHTTDLEEPGCDFPGEDIQCLSFGDGSYDLVVCNQVLEHVPDDGAAIRELSRVLSPRGLAIVTVPCDWQHARTEPFRCVRPGGHYRHYGRDLVERLAQHFESVQVFDMHELDAAPDGLSYGIREGEMVFLCSKFASAGLELDTGLKDKQYRSASHLTDRIS